MHLDYWEVPIHKFHFVLQLHINDYWTTSSLKDLIFALGLNTLTSSKICSLTKKTITFLGQCPHSTLFSGFTQPNLQDVIPRASATGRSPGPTLNFTHAKSQTSASKAFMHEVRISLWVSSPWVSLTSTLKISCTWTSWAYVFSTKRLHSESAHVHQTKTKFARPRFILTS